MSIASEKDIRYKITNIINSKTYRIKMVRLRFKEDSKLPPVDLFYNGKIIFQKTVDNNYFDILYNLYSQCE